VIAVPDRSPPLRLDEAAGRGVLLATVLGSSLAMLDATVVNVALERIGADLDADLAGLQWTLGAYSLTLAALTLLGGALGDRFGRRRVFIAGTIWFAVASALCGLASDVRTLVVARALQGVGGALLTPGSLAIIAASFAPDDRSRAIGAWSGLSGVAGAVGPLAGGWLVEVWSWRLVFLVNLPLAAAVVAVAARYVPESRDPGASGRFDVPGTVLGAVGLAAMTHASITGGERGMSPAVVVTGTAGVLALAAFALVERRSTNPLVPPQLFASRQFTAANLVTFAVYAALSAAFFFLVVHLQVVAGYGPFRAGLSMLPVTAIMLALSARSGALAQRIGPRLQMTAGPLVAAVGLLATLWIGPGAPYVTVVLPAVAVFGFGLAVLVAPLTATVLAAAPAAQAGVASAVNNAVARAAGLLAVAVLPPLAGLSGGDYRDPQAFAAGYRIATLIAAALLTTGGVLSAIGIRNVVPEAAPGQRELRHSYSCPIQGPRLETVQRERA
jgi:EmrB/QacA subfamily drug resistance transporter